MSLHSNWRTSAHKGERIEARLTALVDEHQERVWVALTEPAELVNWLAPGSIDLCLGGAVKLDFADSGIVVDSQVTAIEPDGCWNIPGAGQASRCGRSAGSSNPSAR